MRKKLVSLNSLSAVLFFLFCLVVYSGCLANAANSDGILIPFVRDSKIYSFYADGNLKPSVRAYELSTIRDDFLKSSVSVSKKKGYILAWNRFNHTLYHISEKSTIRSRVKLDGDTAFVDKNYILVQSNVFANGEGFGFALYSINYATNSKRIGVSKVWSGGIDCFVSDYFFTADGVCISGGTKDDSANNAFYITKSGCHKCFSTEKHSDFLRLINTNNEVYAFVSGQDKSAAESIIYHFTLDNYIEGTSPESKIDIMVGTNDLQGFECFFGYGFSLADIETVENASNLIVLPASINGNISFACFDCSKNRISRVVSNAVGSFVPLAPTPEGFYYLARDPLIEGSWYGIMCFDGSECKKIKEF